MPLLPAIRRHIKLNEYLFLLTNYHKKDPNCPEENMVVFLFLWAKIFSTHVRKAIKVLAQK
jgi:hypothetical protein